MNDTLTPNQLTVIALCNEYCYALENVAETDRDSLIASMLRLLPRIYIATADLSVDRVDLDEMGYIDNSLDEDYYESIRRRIGDMLGMDDAYLEVFEDDMKYSDTPIGASISEGLCDIFQPLYNFLYTVKDAPDDVTCSALLALKDDFESYWSRPLCNVMRALNRLRYS